MALANIVHSREPLALRHYVARITSGHGEVGWINDHHFRARVHYKAVQGVQAFSSGRICLGLGIAFPPYCPHFGRKAAKGQRGKRATCQFDKLVAMSLWAKILETRHRSPFDLNRLQEHRQGPHPEPVVIILLAVDHQFLFRLAVTGNTDHGVVLAFVVAVTSRLDAIHGQRGGGEPLPDGSIIYSGTIRPKQTHKSLFTG